MPHLRTPTGNLNTLTRKPGISLSFNCTPPPSLYPASSLASSIFAVKFTFSPQHTQATERLEYDTGLHFHIDKTEALRVQSGSIGVQIGDEMMTVSPQTGEVLIPRWMVHRWWLATSAEETVVWERTLPGSREKEFFFRNLLSYLGDLSPATPPSFFQLYTIFARWDNYPVLGTWLGMSILRPGVVMWTKLVGWVGRGIGYKYIYKEYVPEDLNRHGEYLYE